MANKNETTTKFKVDISELKKAMQDAKRQVAIANSEFKAVTSTMDDWTKSSDGLSAKIKQLDTNLKSQDKILESLEEQYRLTVKEMGEGSKAAQDLQIKINNQKAVIGNTKRQIEKYNEALKELADGGNEVADSTKDVVKALDEVGDSANNAGDGFTVFKGAVAGFVANVATSFVGIIAEAVSSLVNLASETREYRTELGKLETAFASAGFSADSATDTYKDFYSILGDEGQAVEAVSHLAKLAENQEDLAKWTTIATGVYGTFGSSLPIENLTEASNETAKTGQLTGGLADALNWAGVNEDKFQESLDACNTEQERQALITETLMGLYSEAAETYKEVNGDIMDAQRAQSELADATANLGAVAEPVMTSFKLMGAALLTGLLPSVTQLGEAFTDLVNGVEGADESIGEAISNLAGFILDKIVEILPSVLNVGLSLVSNLAQGILNALPQLVTTVLDLASGLLDSLLTTLGNISPQLVSVIFDVVDTALSTLSTLLPDVALKIIELVPLIVSGLMSQLPVFIDSCITFLNSIILAIPSVVKALTSELPLLVEGIINGLLQGADALLQGAITLFMSIVSALPEILTPLVNSLPLLISTITTTLLSNIPLLLSTAIELFMALITSIPTIVVELGKAVPQIVMAIITGLGGLLPQLGELLTNAWNTVTTWFSNLITTAQTETPKIIDKIKEFFDQLPSKLGYALGQALGQLIQWGINLFNFVQTEIPVIISSIVEFFAQLPSKIWTWLVNVVTKIGEWRTNLIAKGKEVANKLVTTIVDIIKKLPDKIKSIGKDIVKGLWNGINDMTSWISGKIQSFGDSVLDGIKDFFGIASPSKVMAAEVGRWLPEGIAVGIDKNAKTVLQSMKDVTMGAVSGARAGLSSAEPLSVGGTQQSGGVVNNFYQTNNSPKALSRLEIYRQTSNLLGFAGGV